MKKLFFSCLGLLLLSAPLRADPLLCLIEPEEVIEIGSPVIGVLDEVTVERADQVRKGQVVAKLISRVEQQAVQVAAFRAKKLAELASAQATNDYARRQEQRAESLMQKNFVSRQYLDQAATDASVAAQKLSQVEENRRQAELELKLSQAQLDLRIIRSPISGVVMERYLSPGQRVEQQTIVKIAKIDPLRVEVIVPAKHFQKITRGMRATVTPELPGASTYTATVSIVDQVIDAASNTFRVRLELPNPGQQIPAGARCKADLLPTAASEAQKTTPAPKPVVPVTVPKTQARPDDRTTAILNAVQAWAKAWSARNIEQYQAAYSMEFQAPDGGKQADWFKNRRDRIQNVKLIDVQIVSPQVSLKGENLARVTFKQIYRSDKFNGETLKTLVLANESGRWLIREER